MLAKFLESIGAVERNILNKCGSNFLILMYHRVIPYKEAEPGLQAGMYVEPETFTMHIHYLKKHFKIIPLNDILNCIDNLSKKRNNIPICMLTFDDGWQDFYKYSYPILETHRVPATVFLPTKYISTGSRFWTDQVANIFTQEQNNKCQKYQKRFSNNNVVKKITGLEGRIESKIERAIFILKDYSDDEISNILNEIKIEWGIDLILNERTFLNWEEVAEMAKSGLISFGSHTENHKMLTYLKNNDILEELIKSKNKLISENIVDKSFIPFCYPNGNYNDMVIRLVKEAGYHVAVTTENGWNNQNASLFNLQRIAIHQDISSTKEMFGCRISNIF